VRLAGLASAVPTESVSTEDEGAVFGLAEAQRIAQSTGIHRRRVAAPGVCVSDLCVAAAEPLLESLHWDRESVEALILVTQSPDYILPATACSLHGRLGLSENCAAFDVNLGCSGYTYGLWLASHLIASGAAQRVLLLAGETATRCVGKEDRSARLLFGDAATVSALEAAEGTPPIYFRVGTDGSGQNHLIVPAGSFRLPKSSATGAAEAGPDGNPRSLDDVYMNGTEIFLFTIDRVPPMIRASLDDAGWDIADVDAFVFHQANQFILKHLAQHMKLPPDKVPFSLNEFGNTSSASVPLTMTVRLAEELRQRPMKLVLAGFGVGLSWSSVALQTEGIVMPPLVEVSSGKLRDRLFSVEDEGASHLPINLRKAFHVGRSA
jgi:3-oxoacyl-[acyl-carrier-protein] synthase-3